MRVFQHLLVSNFIALVHVMAQTVLQIPEAPQSRLSRSTGNVSPATYSARLHVASYDKSLTTFTLSQSENAISLVAKPPNKDCGDDPTWLDLDCEKRKLYCLNEQIESSKGNATITEYDIKDDGNLVFVKKVDTSAGGPVQSKFLPLGNSGTGLHVIAHYS
jgi:hypothetical protein